MYTISRYGENVFGKNQKKLPKKWKKQLTNGGWSGILSKLSATTARWTGSWKSFQEIEKKGLTKRASSGRISKLFEGREIEKRARKKIWKSRKKYLTNDLECAKIANVPPLRRAGRVPCKLNNVTNEKHQSSMSEKTWTW